MRISIRHLALRNYYWWKLCFKPWWDRNPSLTRFLPKWVNKRLQQYGEQKRSAEALAEPETNLPFPYNDEFALLAYCTNRKIAEPDFEPYWQEQQRIMDLQWAYKKLPGPHYIPEITLEE